MWQVICGGRRWGRVALWQGVPIGVAVGVFAGFVVRVKVAGAGGLGEGQAVWAVWGEAGLGMLSMLAGGPWEGTGAWVLGGAIAVATGWVSWVRRREGGWVVIGAWAVAGAMVVGKAVVMGRGEVVFPRYFLLAGVASMVMLLVELGRVVGGRENLEIRNPKKGKRLGSPKRGRILALALLSVVLGANVWQTWRFATGGGRGEYLAPLQVAGSSGQPTLGSDYDSRALRMENFHRHILPDRIDYKRLSDGAWPATPPRWYLAGTGIRAVGTTRIQVGGASYVLRERYRQYGPSGWAWLLYERE